MSNDIQPSPPHELRSELSCLQRTLKQNTSLNEPYWHLITNVLSDLNRVSRLGGSYLRVQIMFNVTKPLPRGIPILFPGMASPTWLELKYEDIPDHCYHCGCLGHSYTGYTEYRRASNESSLPPPLLYKNVLRGTVRPNVNPFGHLLIPNQPRN
ncbi:hypothetical protein G4B88_023781 [Cannabis sativa]|uniref:Zinc knuckle CX2CX4HX4C domain-containing protein n=1 Tax=Cannabis sativa TaxID=3483 RepID=A0A7J6HV58_CANSA|nr:hypothetical protein G4B88_023781 [Cannabis sativa]